MDYEKDYKEALERARKLYNDCVKGDNPIQAQRYVDIFPELNEQPDPRHSLIEFIKWLCDRGSITPEQRKNVDFWLAYLEKRKKQKPESCDCSRDEESYTNGIHHVLMNPEAYGLIKQKPAEWSEEDKTHLCWIIECFDSWKYQVPEFADQYQSAIDWLKSLRPDSYKNCNSRWKPSEEQMKMLAIFANLRCVSRREASTLESLYYDLQKLL